MPDNGILDTVGLHGSKLAADRVTASLPRSCLAMRTSGLSRGSLLGVAITGAVGAAWRAVLLKSHNFRVLTISAIKTRTNQDKKRCEYHARLRAPFISRCGAVCDGKVKCSGRRVMVDALAQPGTYALAWLSWSGRRNRSVAWVNVSRAQRATSVDNKQAFVFITTAHAGQGFICQI